MRIWEVNVRYTCEYAHLLSLYVEEREVLCEQCGVTREPGLLLEWDDGSDQIADFTNTFGRIVVKESVADELLARFTGFKKAPVEFFDHPNLYLPKRITRRTPRRVWLPYEGPPLCELRVTREVDLDERSSVTIEGKCDTCGWTVYKSLEGMEEHDLAKHVPRQPGKGLYIPESDVAGWDFFRPKYTGLVLCSARVKQFVEGKGYTNVEFLEAGDTVP
ncbi:MAG: hypothetical protein RBS80_31525 [Thermoguttaceae bacterium]|jgi:hypothetical protein|nr:hypothetical protein [Thermoguttaceae bacterium]